MDAAFTDEQVEIRRTLRRLLRERCGPDEVKAAVRTAPGHDEALWRLLARQLGLPGLALPGEAGGVGCGPTELALACEETGRALLPSPLTATAVLAAPLVDRLGTGAQRAELLPRIADGELTASLAVPGGGLTRALGLTSGDDGADDGGGWAGGGRAGGVQARQSGSGGWRLYGQVDQVLDGHSAGLLLVAARTGGYTRGRTLLFLVRAGAPGLARTRLTALDETRPQGRIELRDVPAELLGAEGAESAEVVGALARLGMTAAAALAAEAVGAADAALERTVEYVRTRVQFGRPVGSFQAVKHRLAEVYVKVEAARSAAYYAAWAVGRPAAAHRTGAGPGAVPAEAAVASGLALAQALDAQRAAAGEAVQLHGGVGFTWEHDAHLSFKRAASDELLFGPVHRLRASAAEREGLFAEPDASSVGAGAGADGRRARKAVAV
ncbi:acyl-CoA dehydrogenase family protein [Streptomyces sp. ME19-01-6]|uniref:acyl-CoA dehydrogenase family protein n=1 Tax=Streptomyces sp. ME19-01-6 TaxID=3028686 RepID=UPI0029AFA0F6|nr:acyl-CoA dehydrogenase family protein [Streptomyces sp. ME19-01-6]MDX3226374.1 acyl-CoA/acyl-ACP dehydrogenase [Streptomyces sp. ME19-01-6]